MGLLDAADAAPGAAELRARSYDLLALAPGAAVVDVGCGAGRTVAQLTEPGARAVGIDADERMAAAARRRLPDADVRLGDLVPHRAAAVPASPGVGNGPGAFPSRTGPRLGW
ncbi:methyltransferase domain-containing protein [Kitasatospora sp. NPDC101235]|uniref:methyltransferase domain-containing protein n=1 Tax=Kitasatospora sp. NPDC101235 TaxID=3364101 RepID=UPI0038297D67